MISTTSQYYKSRRERTTSSSTQEKGHISLMPLQRDQIDLNMILLPWLIWTGTKTRLAGGNVASNLPLLHSLTWTLHLRNTRLSKRMQQTGNLAILRARPLRPPPSHPRAPCPKTKGCSSEAWSKSPYRTTGNRSRTGQSRTIDVSL